MIEPFPITPVNHLHVQLQTINRSPSQEQNQTKPITLP